MSDYDEHCVSLYAICGMWYASVLMVASYRGLWNLRNARGGNGLVRGSKGWPVKNRVICYGMKLKRAVYAFYELVGPASYRGS